MKGKYIIIIIIITSLVFSIIKMLKIEEAIREHRVVTEFVEDNTKPLIEKFSPETLKEISLKSDYYFCSNGDYFSKLNYTDREKEDYWDTILYKGVNIGVALPGHFPAEFSMTYDEYLEWLIMIGEMHSNVIRLYTILPPEFYEAFAHYNLMHQDNPLYLMQGVWATIPGNHNYINKPYTRDLKKEIIDVIDVLHGKAVLEPVRGKASGIYATDVSKYVAAILFGREWEPTAVFNTIQESDVSQYAGDFVSVNNGNPMEVWLAEMLDFIVLYETQTYTMQHPVSFVNWIPLDPMYHNAEIIVDNVIKEFDNDINSVDFNNFHNTEMFIPGLFASYHVYPYYPDFIYYDDRYALGLDEDCNENNFSRYLEHLKERHHGMPLLISEYGVPSSRGNSHMTPCGYDQGGHSEEEHASKNLELTKDIFNTGCAGAIFFEWADEWFKHNWLLMDFEVPHFDIKNWHNMENPEQNFGILAVESRKKTIDANLNDWKKKADIYTLQGEVDPSFFYLSVKFDDFQFSKNNLYFAIDLIDKERGDHKLPFTEKEFDRGFEFLVEMINIDSARILVDEPYSLSGSSYPGMKNIFSSRKNNNAKFVDHKFITNRGRESLTGKIFKSREFNRSTMVHGNTSEARFSNADWFWNNKTKTLEIRFTWQMLNVCDPGKHYVIDNLEDTREIEYSSIDGIYIYGFVTDKRNNLLKQFPEKRPAKFTWEGWQIPEYQIRLKPIYDTFSNYFRTLEREVPLREFYDETAEDAYICSFYNNKDGAVSFSFDNGDYSQYEIALPLLKTYKVNATFGLKNENLDATPGLYQFDDAGRRKRISISEVRKIFELGYDIACQSTDKPITEIKSRVADLRSLTGGEFSSLHQIGNNINQEVMNHFIFSRAGIGSTTTTNIFKGVSYKLINGTDISLKELEDIYVNNKNGWFILGYRYFVGSSANIPQSVKDHKLFISKMEFHKQVRFSRNNNFWLASEKDVFSYITERKKSHIKTTIHNDLVFLTVDNDLDKLRFNHPLTVCYPTDAKFVIITGSENDGTYTNRTGEIIFNTMPGKEVTIKLIK